jgi:NitT/TauT family transport system ATP-binding protein
VLEVTDLTRSYGRGDAAHVAIDGVSLEVAEGELVSIVGPSGCGKSTLLRCVAGLLAPTGGKVVLGGTPVDRVPDRLAVVFQDYSRSLYPWLSVRDNVALPLQRRVRDRGARRQAAVAALEAVGRSDTTHKDPWQLSGGMQQRVAIARALAYDPVLLLMDEPFGSVDAQTREDLEDLILRVRAERGITILLVTHDIDESVYVGDRVIVLTPGPGRVRAEITTSLPQPRDQITTKELAEFVHLRTEVSRLVRGQPARAVLHGLPRGRFAGFGRRVLAAGKQPAPAALKSLCCMLIACSTIVTRMAFVDSLLRASHGITGTPGEIASASRTSWDRCGNLPSKPPATTIFTDVIAGAVRLTGGPGSGPCPPAPPAASFRRRRARDHMRTRRARPGSSRCLSA